MEAFSALAVVVLRSPYHALIRCAIAPATTDKTMPDSTNSTTVVSVMSASGEDVDDAADSAPDSPLSLNVSRCNQDDSSSSGSTTAAAMPRTMRGAALI